MEVLLYDAIRKEYIMKRYDAIYGRQSVDRVDSISIESQIEYCQYEVRGGRCEVFQDKGYSGKNTDRPQFQQMLEAIRRGEISRVIVYKLDRISRSILDFSNMMEEFQKYGVEFVSCTEKFDTSTPMGRAMLNICIVFAQLERETIQMRVTDAYISRSRRGFYMGGRVPYGYRLTPYMIDGKKTARYIVDPDEAEVVKLIFSMYAQPEVSYGDIVRYLSNNKIENSTSKDGSWDRSRIGDMIKNPVYVKADFDVYRFYKENGALLHNSPDDYIGSNGCYLYSDKDAANKRLTLAGQHVILAPHEGIILSGIWIQARIKCLNNKQIATPLKAKNSWLAGKIKCGKCGYAINVRKDRTKVKRYLICSHKAKTHMCDGIGSINADTIEGFVLEKLAKKLEEFETISGNILKIADPRIHDLRIKIEQKEDEIKDLLDKVSKANDVLLKYINQRIQEIDSEMQFLKDELAQLQQIGCRGETNVNDLKNYMQQWESLTLDDKRGVLDLFVRIINVTENSCKIEWKF